MLKGFWRRNEIPTIFRNFNSVSSFILVWKLFPRLQILKRLLLHVTKKVTRSWLICFRLRCGDRSTSTGVTRNITHAGNSEVSANDSAIYLGRASLVGKSGKSQLKLVRLLSTRSFISCFNSHFFLWYLFFLPFDFVPSRNTFSKDIKVGIYLEKTIFFENYYCVFIILFSLFWIDYFSDVFCDDVLYFTKSLIHV